MQLVCLPAQSLPGGDDDVTEVFLDLPHAQPCPSEAVLIAGGNTQSTREKAELFLPELREGFKKMNGNFHQSEGAIFEIIFSNWSFLQ